MPFITKLDYSDNRQIKQFQLTDTQLSGSTEFGVPFSALTSVLDSALITTSTLTGITSTFSGNTTTTNISFGDPRMVSGSITLSVITDVTSGDTQQGYGFDGVGPYEIDGNTVYSGYTGSTYDFSVTSIEEVATDQWTGETISNTLSILSGATDDYTGRTIWVDVLGITKTRRLILDDEPDVYSGATHVLTRGLSGDVVNFPLSGFSAHTINTDDYTTGATLSGETLEFTRVSGGTYSVELTAFENSGLERIDEGNGDGWRLIDRDPEYYGNIGQTAIDFSLSTVSGSTTMGSTGFGAVTFGLNNKNPYIETLVLGRYIVGSTTNGYSGSNIIISENFDGAPTNFYNNIYNSMFNVFTSTIGTSGAGLGTAVVYESTASGRYLNMYAGQSSAMFGARLSGGSTCTTIVGISNIDLTTSTATANAGSFNTYGPRFIVGVGSGDGTTRANGFVVMSDGTASFPSLSIAEINASDGKSAVTKEYLTGSTSGFTGGGDDYTTSASLTGETLEFTRLSGGTYSVELTGFTNSGLEAVNEGGNDGWRLIGRDPEYYGNIGQDSVDFSVSTQSGSTTNGTTGDYSVTFGNNIENPYNYTLLMGAYVISAPTTGNHGANIGVFSGGVAQESYLYNNLYGNIIGGFEQIIGTSGATLNEAVVYSSIMMGWNSEMYAGKDSMMVGQALSGGSASCTIVGQANVDLTQTVATQLTSTTSAYNPRFIVGGGSWNSDSDTGSRANAFVVMSDGVISAPNLTIAKINSPTIPTNASANFANRTLITKEYLTGSTSGFTGGGDDYTTSASLSGETLEFTRLSGGTYSVELTGFTNSGLEAVNEGGNDGWRLIGRDPTYYGNIGEQSVDFTYHIVTGTTAGVTGDFSVGWGYNNTISGNSGLVGGTGNNIATPNTIAWGEDLTSTSGIGSAIFGDSNAVDGNFNVVGGQNNTISGTSSHCAIFGLNNIITGSSDIGFILGSDGIISGEGAFVIGDNNEGAGVYSFAQGFNNTPSAIYEANFGMWGTEYTPAIDGTDRAFNIGNGTADISRSDSFTVLKGGNVIAPSLTTAMISSGDSKTLITKEYLTGATSGFTTGSTTNTDDYTTGTTFNTTTGILEFTRISGGTYNIDLDGRYSLTGHTHDISDITGFTDNSTNWDSAYNDTITGMTVTGTTTKTITLFQQDGGLVQTNFTDEVGVGAGNDYLTGATFNTSTGDLTLSLFSGSTVIENLDGRYSLTGHTHSEFGDYLPLTGGTLTGPVTGTTFNIDKSQLDYQENLVVDSATTETIATVSVLEHKAVFFDYVVSEGTNIRAGTVMTTFMSSTTSFTDTSTTDIGDTSGVTFSTDISGSDLRLLADTTTDGWEIKVMIRAL